jgi:hypothetical protein
LGRLSLRVVLGKVERSTIKPVSLNIADHKFL